MSTTRDALESRYREIMKYLEDHPEIDPKKEIELFNELGEIVFKLESI